MKIQLNYSDAALVVGLACEIEDRSNAEQAALLKLAFDADRLHNTNVGTNKAVFGEHAGSLWAKPSGRPSDLVATVLATRVLQDGQRDKGLTDKQENTRQRLKRQWAELESA